eukprot:TRINITY_DN4890_c0_g2_i2.p1 TRINITY_DN4890_c0_g2~~TRINITY_DN4890_c0_g2_i2.p1  ORF type:complete len:519 (+),score=52.05 TRINITY_DN4890_c0_g2_i2:94-1650(+)
MDTSTTLPELGILSLSQDVLGYIFSFFSAFFIRIHTLRNVRVSCRRFRSIVDDHFCDFTFSIYQMTDIQTLNTMTRNVLEKITSIFLFTTSKRVTPFADNTTLFNGIPKELNLTRLFAQGLNPIGLSILNERFGRSLRCLSFSALLTGIDDELLNVPSRLDHLRVSRSFSRVSELIRLNQLVSLELEFGSLLATSLYSSQTKLTKLHFWLEDKRKLFEVPTQLISLKIVCVRHVTDTLMTPSELLSHRLQKLVSLDIDTAYTKIETFSFFWKLSTSLRKLTWRRDARSKEPLSDLPPTLTYLKIKSLQRKRELHFSAISTDVFSNLQSLKFLHVPNLVITETPLPPHLTSLTIEAATNLPWKGGSETGLGSEGNIVEFPRELRKFKCRTLDLTDASPNIPSSLQELYIEVLHNYEEPVKIEFLPPNIKKLTLRVWNDKPERGGPPKEVCNFSKVPSSVESIEIKAARNQSSLKGVNFEGIPATVRVIRLPKILFSADQLAKIPPGTAVLECQPLTFDW